MGTFARQPRVVVADDVVDVIDAVAKRLSSDYVVVGRAGDGEALVESVLELAPDLIVTDVSMPKLSGIDALRRLRQQGVQIPTIILTVYEDEDLVKEALALGVRGFVLKRCLVHDLPLAVRAALSGTTFVSEALYKKPAAGDAASDALATAVTAGRLSAESLLDHSGLFITRTERMDWQQGKVPGYRMKILFVDELQKSVTSLVGMEAGTHFPPHRHGGPEELFMLQGDLVVEGQKMKTGDYCRAETDTIHSESYTESGCVFILRSSQYDEILLHRPR